MRIQELLFFWPEDIVVEKLYLRMSGMVNADKVSRLIEIGKDGCVSCDTYFNSFSLKKWKKYTDVDQFALSVTFSGELKVQIVGVHTEHGKPVSKVLREEAFQASEQGERTVDIPADASSELLYPVFLSKEGAVIYQAAYVTKCQPARSDVKVAIDICTFKREMYLKRNMELIRDHILENESSPVYEMAEVFISDNAKTVGDMFADWNHVRVSANANTGGVGGFTRGMLEAKRQNIGITHCLIMDDDAIVDPAVIVRTIQFLRYMKKEYRGYTIGGSLLRQNTPYYQFELGAVWNRGRLHANNHHKNLSDFSEVLSNEQELPADYCGWWYSCIPMETIEEVGLPLPIFIHRDDTEYGIRTGGRFIFLNGIAVWHEAFENKMPGPTEYYDIRNLAIINSISYEDYSKWDFTRMLVKWTFSNIARYRYKYIDMNLRGVKDFLRGVDWLLAQDGTLLHQSIMQMNYKSCKAEKFYGYKNVTENACDWSNMEKLSNKKRTMVRRVLQIITLNGYFLPSKKKTVHIAGPHDDIYEMFRAGEILYVDANGNAVMMKRDGKRAWKAFFSLLQIIMQINRKFDIIKRDYHTRYRELIKEDYWNTYLKLSEENHE